MIISASAQSITEEQIDGALEDLQDAVETPETLQRAMPAAESRKFIVTSCSQKEQFGER